MFGGDGFEEAKGDAEGEGSLGKAVGPTDDEVENGIEE